MLIYDSVLNISIVVLLAAIKRHFENPWFMPRLCMLVANNVTFPNPKDTHVFSTLLKVTFEIAQAWHKLC